MSRNNNKRLGELFSTRYRKNNSQRCSDIPKYLKLHYQPLSLCLVQIYANYLVLRVITDKYLYKPKSLIIVVEISEMYANLLYVLFFGVNIL